MKMERDFRRTTVVFAGVALLTGPVGVCSQAAEADLLPQEPPRVLQHGVLSPEDERRGDAIAKFVQGLLEEESEGPEQSLQTFLESLALDPGHIELALRVSQDYLRRGDTVGAISVLKDAHKARPDNPDPAIALALIYLRHLQKPDLALRFARRAIDAAPRSIGPYEALWEIHKSQGADSKAAEALSEAARSGSRNPGFWIGLAEIASRPQIQRGLRPDEATTKKILGYLKRAVELAGEDVEALAGAGDLMALCGSTSEAVTAYEKAYTLKSSLPGLRHKLSACYIELGRNEDAVKILEETVKLDPLNLAAYDGLSQIHLRLGDIRQAAASARKALILDPRSIHRHEFVVDLFFRLGEFAAAADTLAEARKNFPGIPKLGTIQGIALTNAGRHEEAMQIFAEVSVEASGTQPEALDGDFYFHYGAASEQAGHHEKAAQLFKHSIEADPSNAARSYNYLGYMWVDRNEHLDEAEQLIRRALELEPTNGAYIDSLGWLYFRKEKFEDALATLLKAADHLPEPDSVVWDHIGDTYQKLGRTAEAVLFWNKALGLDPQNEAIAAKVDASAEQMAGQPNLR